MEFSRCKTSPGHAWGADLRDRPGLGDEEGVVRQAHRAHGEGAGRFLVHAAGGGREGGMRGRSWWRRGPPPIENVLKRVFLLLDPELGPHGGGGPGERAQRKAEGMVPKWETGIRHTPPPRPHPTTHDTTHEGTRGGEGVRTGRRTGPRWPCKGRSPWPPRPVLPSPPAGGTWGTRSSAGPRAPRAWGVRDTRAQRA